MEDKATKRLSQIKEIINFHHLCSLPDLTPSAINVFKCHKYSTFAMIFLYYYTRQLNDLDE